MDRPGKRRAVVLALLPAVVFSLALPAGAQQPPRETRSILLGIYRADGSLTSGLEPQHITVKGVRARVVRVTAEEAPRRIVLLLDTSGSMLDKWPLAQKACQALISHLSQDYRVALHVFASRHQVIVPFTDDFSRILDAANTLGRPQDQQTVETYGYLTRAADALAEIMKRPETRLEFGDAIVLVSDGFYPDTDRVRGGQMQRALAAQGVRVFWIGILSEDDRNNAALWGPGHLRNTISLVRETGGIMVDPRTSSLGQSTAIERRTGIAPLARAARRVQTAIRQVYRVELELEERLTKPKKLKLEVRDADGKKLPGDALAYPRHLLPLSATP